jgi:hypothetical protein
LTARRIGIRLSLGVCVVTTACDGPPGDGDSQSGDVPSTMLGRAVTVTLGSGDNEQAAIPGTVVVYRFLSDTRVLGDGYNTLATVSWTWDRESGSGGTMHLQYDERSFEEYDLSFQGPDGGTCNYHFEAGYIGGTPSGDPNEVREFNGNCEFEVDTSCAGIEDPGTCDQSGICQWDGLDPALPVCVPKPVMVVPDCGDYQGPTLEPQRDAQCKAAWAAECGGVPKTPYCDLYNHPTWGGGGSCQYCG